jgi:hypothetical protein
MPVGVWVGMLSRSRRWWAVAPILPAGPCSLRYPRAGALFLTLERNQGKPCFSRIQGLEAV